MPRARKGTNRVKKRNKILRAAKGFKWNRKSKVRLAKEALMKSRTYAYRDRRTRKRDKRALWQVKINAAARTNGTTYSRLMAAIKQRGVILDRKILADLAENEPEVFKSVVETLGDAVAKQSSSKKEPAQTSAE